MEEVRNIVDFTAVFKIDIVSGAQAIILFLLLLTVEQRKKFIAGHTRR